MKRKYPKIIITDEGVPFLKHGQMWMYQNNIAHLDDEIENGAPIDIYTREQEYLGTGFLSKTVILPCGSFPKILPRSWIAPSLP